MIAIVCGLAEEAAVIGRPPGAVVIVGAGDAAGLTARLEAAIAAGADRVISIGICGGLNPLLRAGDVVIGTLLIYGLADVESDVAWSRRISAALAGMVSSASVNYGTITWSATAVARLADKAALRKDTGADAVDEETFIAGSIAAAKGLPFTALRVVCDPASFELPPAALSKLTDSGRESMGAILVSVLEDPAQIPELIDLAGYSGTALTSLRSALERGILA